VTFLGLRRTKRRRGKTRPGLLLIIAPVGDAPSPDYTCGICGFVMNEVGECPRCKLEIMELERDLRRKLATQTPDVSDQVRELLDE
jgi:hypothetical protein